MAARSSRNRTTAPGPVKARSASASASDPHKGTAAPRATPRRLRRVALQLDDEVVQHFKKLSSDAGKGERYTALINQVLLEYVQAMHGGRGDVTVTQMARMLRVELERLAVLEPDGATRQ